MQNKQSIMQCIQTCTNADIEECNYSLQQIQGGMA